MVAGPNSKDVEYMRLHLFKHQLRASGESRHELMEFFVQRITSDHGGCDEWIIQTTAILQTTG